MPESEHRGNHELLRKAEAVFKLALDRTPGERQRILGEHCEGDPSLQQEVESLLANYEGSPSFLESPFQETGSDSETGEAHSEYPRGALPAGTRVSSYTIVGVVGVGGMGIVYRATQDFPQRVVALKLIRPGLASEQMLRRFEHEAQILGRLQHPGIAQIYEAGTADMGSGPQPFFAMAFIQGRPMLAHADDRRLGLRDRLEILARICDAVHHAHQRGVVHRDLKPGNILVDEAGQPQVLDFGVARAIDSDMQITTLQTNLGQLIGTIPYMSPEQCAGDPHEMDTRSDVYSLGIIGYELLTGRLPYDLRAKTLPEAVRIIRDQDAPPLSSVSKVLRGDVETIIAKALEKDKERRYASASEFASDLRRFLRHEPIHARPTGRIYRLRKFVYRNKALVLTLSVAFVSLLIGVVATTSQAVRATRERNRALEAESVAQRRRVEVQSEAEKARLIQNFLHATLDSVDWSSIRARDVMVFSELLDEAATKVEFELAGQREVASAVREAMGMIYRSLGRDDAAEGHLRASLESFRLSRGEEHPETLRAMFNLAVLLHDQGQYAEAETLYRQTLETRRRVLGDEHSNTVQAMTNLAALLQMENRFDEAEPLLVRALEVRRRVLGENHPQTLIARHNLGRVLRAQGRPEEAEAQLRELLDRVGEALPTGHLITLVAERQYGECLTDLRRFEEAESFLLHAYAGLRDTLGADNPRTGYALGAVIRMYRSWGRPDSAAQYEAALTAAERPHASSP